MKYFLPLLLALVAFNHSAFARLGETEKQIVARYGVASGEGRGVISGITVKNYSKNGIGITVYYIDGKSVQEDYSFPGNTVADDTVNTLLELNSLGSEWDLIPDGSTNKAWKLRDGGGTASLNMNKLEVTSAAYTKHFADFEKQQSQGKPANPTQGF